MSPTALVVGAGAAGLRAAMDLAAAGCEVDLVDASAALGGLLGKLDHQFPTDHCGFCRLLPDLRQETASQVCLRTGLHHDRITVRTGTTLVDLRGEPGAFEADLVPTGHLHADVVILAPGAGTYDPASDPAADRYRVSPDVVTALEFEHLLGAAGSWRPGPLRRPSDGRPVGRVAWIQCVGSREPREGRDCCSSVCCMFALKEVRLARQRDPGLETTLFCMDLRTFGRDHQRYLRAVEDDGGRPLRVVRCRPHQLTVSAGGGLRIRFFDDAGRPAQEIFDLVVLSTGQATRPEDALLDQLAARPGVLRAGTGGLTDLATAVTAGGAAAARALGVLRALGRAPRPPAAPSALAPADGGPAPVSVPVTPRVLIVGGGLAGLRAARTVANLGMDVVLVERTDRLGGRLARTRASTAVGPEGGALAEAEVRAVEGHPRITVHRSAEIVESQGRTGHFRTRVRTADREVVVEHGAVILASGGHEAGTRSFGHGRDPRVLTWSEAAEALAGGRLVPQDLTSVVHILCVDAREGGARDLCSRVCCPCALASSVALRRANPDCAVVVLYRDLMAPGELEARYTEARREGVSFVRFEPGDRPEVVFTARASPASQRGDTPAGFPPDALRAPPSRALLPTSICAQSAQTSAGSSSGRERLVVRYTDPLLRIPVEVPADLVVLGTGVVPEDTSAHLARVFGVDRTEDGFFREADAKWRPVDASRDGVFLAGLALAPGPAADALCQAEAAAGRAFALLSQPPGVRDVARVSPFLCARCGLCVPACPWHARRLGRDLEVDPLACRTCGACVVACPNGATFVPAATGDRVLAQLEDILSGPRVGPLVGRCG